MRQDKEAIKDQKLIQFTQIKDIKIGEDMIDNDIPVDGEDKYRFKLILTTHARDYTLYCRTDLERNLWLENF